MAYESDDDSDEGFVRKALEKYERAYEREQTNISNAISDLEFRSGEGQWPSEILRQRDIDHRPSLTVNRIPTFVRSVTGQMRIQRPGIKVVPIDSRGDPKTAEVLGGLIRYVENRSDATHAYNAAIDSQVTCGIGHFRILTEYSDDQTFDQEIRINAVDDSVNIVWDADSKLPNREDARCCFVPVDLSHDVFKERYPDAPLDDFSLSMEGNSLAGWYGDSYVRVAEYWERVPAKRMLCLLPDGTVDDCTDDKKRLAEYKAAGYRLEERPSHRIMRSVISACHLLEKPTPWPGRYIPIIPVIGEEVVINRRTYRHGVVRYLKDSQRAYNYFRSAETEAIALAPKAPWLLTERQVPDYEDAWLTSNSRNAPYLLYNPDARPGVAPPQRVNAHMQTEGMIEGLQLATEEMMSVTGIYDAALGRRSNEVSGKAIEARGNQSDVGTAVYADNFARAIKHAGKIILDLVPTVYDAERVIRICGDDGAIDLVNINQRGVDPVTGLDHMLNDVTVAAYDVALEQGPSYATKMEESRDGMLSFLQQAPSAAPVVLDLIAKAQQWPSSDLFAKRLRTLLPPAIQAQEAEASGEPPPAPPAPPPELIMKQQEMQAEAQKLQVEAHVQQAKAEADIRIAAMRLEEKKLDFEAARFQAAAQEQKTRMELEIKQLDLEQARVASESEQVKALHEAAFKANGSPQQ